MSNLSYTPLEDPAYLHCLLQARKVYLFTTLGEKMALAGKAGRYDSWMFEEIDLIQFCGKSLGEEIIADRFALTLETSFYIKCERVLMSANKNVCFSKTTLDYSC